MPFEVRIPQLGESVSEGVIARWAKQDGEPVRPDDVLLELETDKASMEIPAERGGVLRILKNEGETVSVGDVVAVIDEDERAAAGSTRPAEQKREREEKPAAAPAPAAASDGGPRAATGDGAKPAAGTGEPARPTADEPASPNLEAASEQETITASGDRSVGPLSPAVRHLIDEHKLDPARIPATGKGGRLTKADVLAYVERPPDNAPAAGGASPAPQRDSPSRPPAGGAAPGAPSARPPAGPSTLSAVAMSSVARPQPTPSQGEGEERVPMSRIRKRIAERLVEAQHTAAILTTFNEIDMSAVMALRAAHKDRFKTVHGVALGFMSFFARACVFALREIPVVNAEIRGDDVVYKHYVHLGIAVGTERGLVVPVVHHAERLSFAEIEREIARLAELARTGKLTIDDLSGGTFTISNGGVYGSLMSTPILNPPQSGILGMHKIQKRPVVVDDQITVRPMMYVALSYDHRMVDGEQAVTFLVRVKERLEDPARLLLEV